VIDVVGILGDTIMPPRPCEVTGGGAPPEGALTPASPSGLSSLLSVTPGKLTGAPFQSWSPVQSIWTPIDDIRSRCSTVLCSSHEFLGSLSHHTSDAGPSGLSRFGKSYALLSLHCVCIFFVHGVVRFHRQSTTSASRGHVGFYGFHVINFRVGSS